MILQRAKIVWNTVGYNQTNSLYIRYTTLILFLDNSIIDNLRSKRKKRVSFNESDALMAKTGFFIIH